MRRSLLGPIVIGLTVAAAGLTMAACGGGSPLAAPPTPTPRFWLGAGSTITVTGDQDATLVQSVTGGDSTTLESRLHAVLRLHVDRVDGNGTTHLTVTPQAVNGTNAGGISVDVGTQASYGLVLGPDLQIVGGRLWPDWGSAAETQGVDAFSALRAGESVPTKGSWATQVRRAYLAGSGAMAGRASSSASGYNSAARTETVRTTLTTPFDYDDHSQLMHLTGSVDHQIVSSYVTDVAAVTKTTDDVNFTLDYTMTGGSRGHEEGVISTKLTFA